MATTTTMVITSNKVKMVTAILKIKEKASFNNRTLKSIISLFILRGGNIAIQLLIIPVSIKFVSSASYGLWLTVSSMIGWLSIMDIGLSNGLRNKLTEAIAEKDFKLAKTYVSTTYGLLGIMSLIGLAVVFGVIYLLNWHNVLHIPEDLSYSDFKLLLIIVGVSFFISFILKPIASVAYALHRPGLEYLIIFLSNFVNLGIIWIFTQTAPAGSLLSLATLFCFTPIVVTLILSVILYNKTFKDFSPSATTADFKYARTLTSLSLKFFVIQISAIVVFTTNNFMISHFFGNEDVTRYNVVSKYFNVPIMLQGMILLPFWTHFTEAYVKRNKEWLNSIMKKLLNMALLFSAACFLMVIGSSFIYRIWLGELVQIPLYLTVTVGVFTILTLVAAVFSTFLNGTGRIKLQMYTSLIPCFFHIPLTVLVVKYFHAGIIGVIGVSCFWLVATLPLRYIQYRKIISFSDDNSIWNS
ncbi:hypothetical protein GS399_14210 [Pedobacter sp. HMF7647]|uniref:Oligosaccharide flippase family protein n=1 Tax=Hufsiella arboris TaxID=2695275 RepID=A0A7K1YDL5_9SPHI|nr:hypothetical protein [Hufsiella arboris]MXV52128.1 hypothetical protein [Hufsiella arboris]